MLSWLAKKNASIAKSHVYLYIADLQGVPHSHIKNCKFCNSLETALWSKTTKTKTKTLF